MAKTHATLTLLLATAALTAHAGPQDSAPEKKPAVPTSLQMIACPGSQKTLSIYSKDGQKVAIISAGSPVNKFQGWGENEATIKSQKMVRIQIPTEPDLEDIFADEESVLTADACTARTGVKLPYEVPAPTTEVAGDKEDDDDEDDESDAPVLEAAKDEEIAAFSLDSAECCRFPLATRPKSFLGGMARFGAGRKRGRMHGGADLYGVRGQSVLAVTSGTVVRAPYLFKSGTLAVDVRHKGGFVVRYGEISGKSFGLQVGTKVTEGQKLGEMKYVPGAPAPMTHFELYKGNKSGKLSVPGNQYSRRSDILNPTPYLVKWGAKK